MRGKSQTYTVKDGRIRITCSRCARKQYVTVPAGLRKKMIRCTCGQSALYTLNFRSSAREATSGKAFVILPNGRECPVYLCDISLGGVGFNVPVQYSRTMANVPEARIKFRSITGSMVLRRIRIKCVSNNRIGAEFLDGKPPTF